MRGRSRSVALRGRGTGGTAGAPAPELLSATVAADGETLTLVFSEAVTGHDGFGLTASGGYVAPAYSSGEGTDTLAYTLSRVVAGGETVALDYTP